MNGMIRGAVPASVLTRSMGSGTHKPQSSARRYCHQYDVVLHSKDDTITAESRKRMTNVERHHSTFNGTMRAYEALPGSSGEGGL